MTTTPVPSPSASPTGAVFSDPAQLLFGIEVILGFALLAVLVVIIFILLAQWRYFGAVEYLARRGMVSTPGRTEATIAAVAGLGPGGAAADVNISGPKVLVVGEPAEFVARAANQAVQVTWALEGAANAKLEPAGLSDHVRVTAAEAGAFGIVATEPGGSSQRLFVHAEKPAGSSATVLGYIGAGWGSIVVAIIAAAVIAALGIAGVLDGQAIAGLFGALIGYLFGFQLRPSGGSSGTAGGQESA